MKFITLVKSYCKDCGKKLGKLAFYNKVKMCRSCSTKSRYKNPKNNPNWKGGKPNCLDCNKKLSQRSYKRCKSCSQTKNRIKLWQTNSYRNKFCNLYLKGRKLYKNKQEKIIHSLIGNKYKFNNRTKIYGFIPDFINDKDKKIIEFFGSYWHQNKNRERRRLNFYKKSNYKTLIIWDFELKNIKNLERKIELFKKLR